MSMLFATGVKPTKYPNKHDPQEKKYYSFSLRAPERLDTFEYLIDDVVAPVPPNGFYYICTKPGVSGATAPAWSSSINGVTSDGTVQWLAQAYNLLLRNGDSFVSTWTATEGVVLDNPGSDIASTWVRVAAVPNTISSFTLTNHIVVTRRDGKIEEYDRSMIIPIAAEL